MPPEDLPISFWCFMTKDLAMMNNASEKSKQES
jgi:hypothetical protein